MKKGLLAGVGMVVLLGGSVFGIKSAFADTNQAQNNSTQVVQAPKADNQHLGKRFNVLSQHKDQIHQINKLKEDRLDLSKQMVEKRDQLVDLLLAAKQSGNKDEMKQAKTVKQQLKSLNQDIKNLLKDGQNERKALKQAVKNNSGAGTDQFNQLISTNQQINAKMKEKIDQLNKLITIFSSKASA